MQRGCFFNQTPRSQSKRVGKKVSLTPGDSTYQRGVTVGPAHTQRPAALSPTHSGPRMRSRVPHGRGASAHARVRRVTAYLRKAGGGELSLLAGAVAAGAAAIVGRTSRPLLAVPGYPRSGRGGHNGNLGRHSHPEPCSSPLPTRSRCRPWNFRPAVTSVSMV